MRHATAIGTWLVAAVALAEGQLVLQNRTEGPLSGEIGVVSADGNVKPRRFELPPLDAAQVAYWPGEPPSQVRLSWNGRSKVLVGPNPDGHRGRLTWHLWIFADRAEIRLSPPPRPEPEKREGVARFAYFGAAPLTLGLIWLAVRAKRKQANGKPTDKPIILS